MKIFYFFIAFVSLNSVAQDITGQWTGSLDIEGTQLRLVFNIVKTNTGYSATMDSPDQGANGIPVNETTFTNSELKINASNLGIQYIGNLEKDGIISGDFSQGGVSIPLNLSRGQVEKSEKTTMIRPQNPIEPYPYHSEDIIFKNKKANIDLAGTLTLPNTSEVFPVVVMISGSGPQDRNQEIMGHKPFLVISDYLTKNGIGVLRFDDRGTALSKGDFASSTTADFATDVEAVVNYLKTRSEINKKQIGLIGHSEGGVIAPMVASKSKDIAFIILLAGVGMPGDELLLLQQRYLIDAMGVSEEVQKAMIDLNTNAFALIKKSSNNSTLKPELSNTLKLGLENIFKAQGVDQNIDDQMVDAQLNQFISPWMQYFIKYDPASALSKVNCLVLALNGSKDLQVPPKENLSAIKNALIKADNKDYTIKELPELNHLFQESTTGMPQEYEQIEQTFSPVALSEMLQWINIHTK